MHPQTPSTVLITTFPIHIDSSQPVERQVLLFSTPGKLYSDRLRHVGSCIERTDEKSEEKKEEATGVSSQVQRSPKFDLSLGM